MPFCYNDIGHPAGVTEKRIELVLQITEGMEKNRFCVFSAGYSKNNPTKQCANRPISLAYQMEKYVRDRQPPVSVRIYSQALGWGTLHEMLWAIRIAKSHFNFDDNTTVIVVSSEDHLPRIRKYARWVMPKDWWVQYHAIDHKLNELWKERIKFWKDFPKLVWFRFKTALGFPLWPKRR